MWKVYINGKLRAIFTTEIGAYAYGHSVTSWGDSLVVEYTDQKIE